MAAITLNIPDELARRLSMHEGDLARVIEAGLQQVTLEKGPMFDGFRDALESLASAKDASDILSLRPSAKLAGRIEELTAKRKSTSLTPAEEQEWNRYELLEHVIRLAKARAVANR